MLLGPVPNVPKQKLGRPGPGAVFLCGHRQMQTLCPGSSVSYWMQNNQALDSVHQRKPGIFPSDKFPGKAKGDGETIMNSLPIEATNQS